MLRRDEYSKKQKLMQTCIILFVPFLGSIFVHLIVRDFDRTPKPRSPHDGMGGDSMPGGVQ